MTQPKRRGRPPTGQTPVHSVRVNGAVWDEAKKLAEQRGETITQVIEAALRRYIQRHRD